VSMPTPRSLQTPIDATPTVRSGHSRSVPSVTAVDTPSMRVAVASATGTRHAQNEDAHSALDPAVPLFVVADGVGGGAFAAEASRGLVTHLHAALAGRRPTAEALRTALLDADRAIARSIANATDACGAATVALGVALDESMARWLVAWVGDCRAYRLRGTEPPELLTADDTYQNLGEATPPGGSPHDPARMVGNGAVDRPNVREIDLARGDFLLLCSDGVHKHVRAADLAAVKERTLPLARRCARLVETARANGSRDDATVLAVQRRNGSPRALRVAAVGGTLALLLAMLAWLGPSQDRDLPGTLLTTVAQQGMQR